MTSANAFISHALCAVQQPLNQERFEAAYREVVAELGKRQTWDVNGLSILSPESVYPPHMTSSTRLLVNSFPSLGLSAPKAGQRLLEVGCGAGAIALSAARLGWTVSAGDIQPECVEATKHNASVNGLALDVRLSDLMDGFADELFDVIVFNQPFYHPESAVADECSLSDPLGSLHVRFLTEAKRFLRPGGRLVFGFANCSNAEVLEQPGWQLNLRVVFFEAEQNYMRGYFEATPLGV